MATILVVDDQAVFREPIEAVLRTSGFQVVTASNGVEALAATSKYSPDLVLLDLGMPVMDGLAETEKIRASDGLNGTPIIAVTAHQETDFRAGAKAAGFDAYVTKPIDIDFLSELIRGLLA